jgi:hypothetical protein
MSDMNKKGTLLKITDCGGSTKKTTRDFYLHVAVIFGKHIRVIQ